ncbi:hypothetical protein HC752_15200 [Vibrio sp. S9_S30]|uniref:GTPase family protein n=1 Tax=Vibrio sp. S9_S30 TaxID=2720226 RepID=UPI0016817446|nr:GTPase [Vibrio sp. S9_S30]MBD1558284.1 hypothetical protein [Vibrio sp. S9_S30]
MTRVKKGLKSLNRYAGGLVAVSLMGIIFPLLVLSGLGLYVVIENGYMVPLAMVLLISALMVFIPRVIWKKSNENTSKESSEDFVEPSDDWSDSEQEIWSSCNQAIERLLSQNEDWGALKAHGFDIAEMVAQSFGKKELDFTVPEGLQLMEEISRRYRKVLNEHVPAVDLVKVSQIKWLYDASDKYGETALKLGKRGMLAWRILRATNPAAAVANEVRSKMLSSITDQISDNLQRNAKRALLQEVTKVCIDLYSGRYTIDDHQISTSKIDKADEKRRTPSMEPVRITLVGQLSAGKSSLVNALTNEMNAEVDLLPTTDGIAVYQCNLEGDDVLKLVDMPGLDGSEKSTEKMLKQMTQSDLVLWVLKANQSSRQLDVTLAKAFEAFYQRPENISLKKPKLIGVMNQVDKLKPTSDWSPPYDLNDTGNSKSMTIRAAMAFNQNLLPFDQILPLAIPEDNLMFGLLELEETIQLKCDEAKNVQLNRQRHEAKGSAGLLKQGKRLFKAGGKVVSNIF